MPELPEVETTRRGLAPHVEGRRITGVVAEDIMTTPVNTISPDASIEDAATVMVSNRSNPLPVVDEDGRMIGIISRTDILGVIEEMELKLEREGEDPTA